MQWRNMMFMFRSERPGHPSSAGRLWQSRRAGCHSRSHSPPLLLLLQQGQPAARSYPEQKGGKCPVTLLWIHGVRFWVEKSLLTICKVGGDLPETPSPPHEARAKPGGTARTGEGTPCPPQCTEVIPDMPWCFRADMGVSVPVIKSTWLETEPPKALTKATVQFYHLNVQR